MQKISRSNHIYIDNVGSKNLGAWLMLESISDTLFEKYSYSRLGVVNPKGFSFHDNFSGKLIPGRNHNIQFLREQNLFFGKNPFTILAKHFLNKPTEIKRNQIPYISSNECSTLLDAGGFWLGSPWITNSSFLESKIKMYSTIRARGGKVIFLPQAFGKLNPTDFIQFFKNVDLIYARDQVSLKNLQEVCEPDKTRIAPDFTQNLNPTKLNIAHSDFLIIPNSKIIQHQQASFDELVDFYCALWHNLRRNYPEAKISFLNHAGSNDEMIISAIADKTSAHCIQPVNPDEAKSYVKNSKIVFSARYHGIINALYTGTPCMAMGWSHKYNELLNEFGLDGFIFEPKSDEIPRITQAFDHIMLNYSSYSELINQRNKAIKQYSSAMWQEIFSTIE